MGLLVFLHGTVLMQPAAAGRPREERVAPVRPRSDPALHDSAAYVPVGGAVAKLRRWRERAARIAHLTPHGAARRQLRRPPGREPRHRRRVRLRQIDAERGAAAAPAAERRADRGTGPPPRARPALAPGRADAGPARARARDDLPGPADEPEPDLHDRDADARRAARPPPAERRRPRGSAQ